MLLTLLTTSGHLLTYRTKNRIAIFRRTCVPRCSSVRRRFGCSCSCRNWYRISADTPGCHPRHRRLPDRRRLLGNKMTEHTNDMCSMRNSRSCPTVRRRGWGPHTYQYFNSNTALLGMHRKMYVGLCSVHACVLAHVRLTE